MDKTFKVIFALIAAGLWVDAASNATRTRSAGYAERHQSSVHLISRGLDTLVEGGAPHGPTNGYFSKATPCS